MGLPLQSFTSAHTLAPAPPLIMGNAAGLQASIAAAKSSEAAAALLSAPLDIDKLSEDDVLRCLDRVGLGAYKPTFTDFGVVGATVLDLDKDMLKNDMFITNENDCKLILDLVAMVKGGASASKLEQFFTARALTTPRRAASISVPGTDQDKVRDCLRLALVLVLARAGGTDRQQRLHSLACSHPRHTYTQTQATLTCH